MKIIIDYAGNSYETEDSDEETAEQLVDSMYSELGSINKLKLQLKGGGFLMLGKKAIDLCAIQVFDT